MCRDNMCFSAHQRWTASIRVLLSEQHSKFLSKNGSATKRFLIGLLKDFPHLTKSLSCVPKLLAWLMHRLILHSNAVNLCMFKMLTRWYRTGSCSLRAASRCEARRSEWYGMRRHQIFSNLVFSGRSHKDLCALEKAFNLDTVSKTGSFAQFLIELLRQDENIVLVDLGFLLIPHCIKLGQHSVTDHKENEKNSPNSTCRFSL